MGVTLPERCKVFIDGKEIGSIVDVTIREIEEIKSEKIDYSISFEFETTDNVFEKLHQLWIECIIIAWKKCLAWVAFCVDYFRKN